MAYHILHCFGLEDYVYRTFPYGLTHTLTTWMNSTLTLQLLVQTKPYYQRSESQPNPNPNDIKHQSIKASIPPSTPKKDSYVTYNFPRVKHDRLKENHQSRKDEPLVLFFPFFFFFPGTCRGKEKGRYAVWWCKVYDGELRVSDSDSKMVVEQ